jgi:ribosome-binding factor A
MSIRTERIGEQIREELSRLLRDEVSDPRIGLVSLTRVSVAPDLSTAAIFWSPLDVAVGSDVAEAERGLSSAAGFLRKRLAKELSLRRTPELRFRHDASLQLGSETLSLLKTLEDTRTLQDETKD